MADEMLAGTFVCFSFYLGFFSHFILHHQFYREKKYKPGKEFSTYAFYLLFQNALPVGISCLPRIKYQASTHFFSSSMFLMYLNMQPSFPHENWEKCLLIQLYQAYPILKKGWETGCQNSCWGIGKSFLCCSALCGQNAA